MESNNFQPIIKNQPPTKPLPAGRDKPTMKRAKKVYLFCDEFTNYNDTEIGIKAILLLEKLGYEVIIPKHEESGRTWLSKGLVRDAKKIINKNTSPTDVLHHTPFIDWND